MSVFNTIDEHNVNRALCAQPDIEPDWFFKTEIEHVAVAICRDCPLIQECATYALTENVKEGVWGGLTEANRATLLRRANRMKSGR
jgi:WhiB family redox-sensing transcriptional regulator